jgi:hypothetical protein
VGKVDVNMTGHGGWTSTQVLADYQNMVGQYAPDLVFYIIGANDLDQRVPVLTTLANIESFIAKTRSAKPHANIVLITTTPMDAFPKDGVAGELIDGMCDLALEHGCYFVDNYEVFKNIPTALWRVDNVHMTIQGGSFLYKHIRNLVFPSMATAAGYIPHPEYQFPVTVPEPVKRQSSVTITFDETGNPTVSAADQVLISVSVDAAGLVMVTPVGGGRICGVNMLVMPPVHFFVAQMKQFFPNGAWELLIVNIINNPPALVTAKAQLANTYLVVQIG